jgi:hypothetical protein
MTAKQKTEPSEPVAEWTLPPSATLGSAVRAKGIAQEIRARLGFKTRKYLEAEAGRLALTIPDASPAEIQNVCAVVDKVLEGLAGLPVIPREVEDILAISAAERHRWLKDGRLKSAGTRTVKLRGRSKAVTFHVFDPHHIEDVLDRDLPALWREEDAIATAENRRRAAGKAAETRAKKNGGKVVADPGGKKREALQSGLKGWDDFDMDGLLR